ncbi:MAG: heat-inducible transcriptional repressor HrcA [Bacteroidetes bacterium HLUCCA01]|nr:MAG: heat-inducible transcriptional repressor HrcA [Bacteroidetes bacterium HLUCCA01]
MSFMEYPELSQREKEVLQFIIQDFIKTASPVASRSLVSHHQLNVSSATVRNAMNSLETKGFLDHPHTSAGRVPTDMGYRFYVHSLMHYDRLTRQEQQQLDRITARFSNDIDDGVITAARLLARLSNLLAVVVAPKLANGIFNKLEIISLSSTRLLIVLTIQSGLAKTVNIEVESEISRGDLDRASAFLNDRLQGQKLSDIARHIADMLRDYEYEDRSGLVRVFIDSADTIFEDQHVRKFHFGGAEYIAMQPEFSDLSQYRSIVELIEDEDMIIHLLENQERGVSDSEVRVRIGSEHNIQQIEQCSVVSASYTLGSVTGTIGLVGPKRMNYPRMIALVEQLANRFNKAKFDY